MDVVGRSLRWQRVLLCAVPAAAALVFLRAAYDVFNTTKATVIVVGTVVILLVGAYRASRTRRIELPRGPVVVAAGLFALALVLATATSPLPLASVVGRPGRHTGLALYLTYLVLFVVAARLYRDTAPAALPRTLLAAAVPVTLYGLLQAAGVEPFGWQAVEGGPQVFSTFGNANFFAAFLGMVMPLGVWAALSRSWSGPWRTAAGSLAGLAFLATSLSQSQQGPAVALAGGALVGATALAGSSASRRVKVLVFSGAGLAALLVATTVLAGLGPLASVRASLGASLATRIPKWQTALAVFRDHPVTGVGLDRFADWFYAYRPAGLAAQSGLIRSTDTPHDVPIEMLVSGGVPLGVSYVAFVGLTGWALVSGLRTNVGEDRLLLAGLGGAWLAYQLQSLVSIDVPPVAVLHYVLAGAIVGLGTRPALMTLRLPGAVTTAGGRGRGGAHGASQPALAPASPLVNLALVLVGAAALFVATLPLRADLAAGSATRLAAQPQAALLAYRRAAAMAPWEARYPALAGGFLTGRQGGRAEDALAAHLQAAEREPRGLAHALNVARLSELARRPEDADAWWERVLEIDPTTPEVLAEAGSHWLERGDLDRARRLVEQAVATRESDASLWVAVGEVRAATRDVRAAREAFQRALELDPQVEGGAEGLARLEDLA